MDEADAVHPADRLAELAEDAAQEGLRHAAVVVALVQKLE